MVLLPVFLDVGAKLGVTGPLFANRLLFATNLLAAMAPQASSANPSFANSGQLAQGEMDTMGTPTAHSSWFCT